MWCCVCVGGRLRGWGGSLLRLSALVSATHGTWGKERRRCVFWGKLRVGEEKTENGWKIIPRGETSKLGWGFMSLAPVPHVYMLTKIYAWALTYRWWVSNKSFPNPDSSCFCLLKIPGLLTDRYRNNIQAIVIQEKFVHFLNSHSRGFDF